MVKRLAIAGLLAFVLGIWASLATSAFLRSGVTADGKSKTPALSTDPDGRVYLVWVDRRKGSPAVLFNRSDDGGVTWQGSDRQVYLAPSEESQVVELAVWGDGRGKVYTVWRRRHTGDEIWVAASNDFGVSWRPALRISSRGTGFRPHLSADREGRVYVVWYEEFKRMTHYGVHFNASSDRGTSWLPQDLRLDPESPPATAALPHLANDEAGHVYVVWREAREGPQEIMFTSSSDGGKTWGRPAKVTQSGSHTEQPRVATDGAGHVYVAWMDWRHGGQPDIYFTASPDHGRTWLSKDIRLNTNPPGSAEAYSPQLGATGQGHVYVTWMDRRNNGQPDVFFTASADRGRAWFPENRRLSVLSAQGRHARLPRLAADGAGWVWVAWEDLGPVAKLFYSVSKDYGKTWLPQEIALSPADPAKGMHVPSLGVLRAGQAAVAWEERKPPTNVVEGMNPHLLPADVVARRLKADAGSP